LSDDRPENEHREQCAGKPAAALEQALGAGEQRLEGGGQHGGEEERRAERPDDVDGEPPRQRRTAPRRSAGGRRRGAGAQGRTAAFERRGGDTLDIPRVMLRTTHFAGQS